MRIENGTRIRLCATALFIAAAAFSGLAAPAQVKDAVGCSLVPDSGPRRGGCFGDGPGCYECYYNYGSVELICYENIDGSISHCTPSGSGGSPLPV
ncbi:hypothetical protein EHM82_01695 [bacterium]|nr:MAG: hypothetical protein EHM82_01695 [bacterium]